MASRTNIPNPYSDLPVRSRSCLQTHIDPEVHKYLDSITARTPGAVSSIVTTLIAAFVAESRKRKLPAQFDPENESRIIDILTDLSFKRRPAAARSVAS